MDNCVNELQEKFRKIKDRGWIKSISKSDGSVGITFEALLGKKENNSILPDYNGIELKCSASVYSYSITLFSINFDGPTKYETQRLANLYGKRDSIVKDKNTLHAFFSYNNKYLVNNMYYFGIKIDEKAEMIYLVISSINGNVIEEKCFIRFESLKKHLSTKLNCLAMISANKKRIDGVTYFSYSKLEMFQLKSFNSFLEAIKKDKVKISLILRIRKSKLYYGTPDYKNLTFTIKKCDLHYIFDKK